MKPLLLLDVDGVLCPFDSTIKTLEPVWGSEDKIQGGAVWNPEHTPWLKELSEHFELVWATMWGNDANELLAPLHDLEELPWIDFKGTLLSGAFSTWKLPEVQRWVGNRPCAWIDDDLFSDAHKWAARRNTTIPTMVITVHPSQGLNEFIVSQLRLFAKETKERNGT